MTASAISASSGLSSISSSDRSDDVERALDDEVDALEHRRAQLEQRHGLAGDELGAVDEDLHRRRRDPHAHAAAVARVDELDRLLLGEVGVGDDDLVDLLALEDVAEVRRAARASAARCRAAASAR